MNGVRLQDPIDPHQMWHVYQDGSAVVKGSEWPPEEPGIQLCPEDVAEQAPGMLKMALVAGLDIWR
jgi:hypothetical protein